MKEETGKRYYLKDVDLFRDLSSADMAWLDSITSMVNYRKGQLIYSPEGPSEALFLLKKGKVELYRLSPEGRKLVLAILDAGTFFGEMSLVGQSMQGAFAEVLEDAMTCVMTRDDVVRILAARPAVALRLVDTLGQRLLETQAALDALAFRNLPARLAGILLRLAKVKGSATVVEGFGHQELADMVVALRESVTEVLNQFKASGLVGLGRRHVTILDRDGLNRIAMG